MDLTKLNLNNHITLDQDFTIDKTNYQNHNILDLKDLHIKGDIGYNDADNLVINLLITGTMYLKDSITLEPIKKPLNIKITENDTLESEYLEEYYKKDKNILDIIPILWENIVLEVPMRLTESQDIKLSGEGWSFGEEEKKEDNIDPRLAKLNELLED